MRKIFQFLFLIFISLNCWAGYFEDTVNEIIIEKIGEQYSLNLRFESGSKYNKIIENEDKIDYITLTLFSPKTKSFKTLVNFTNGEKIEIFGKFDAYYEVPISTRFIRQGQEISPGDVKLSKTKKLSYGEVPEKDLAKIFGQQAKVNIQAGQIIKKTDLRKPPVIKENDPVTLIYSSNSITLKTTGIALSQGAIGDKIRVKNEKTGIVVFGEIIDKNVIKVNSNNE